MCVCLCVCVCVWLYGAVVCAVDFQSKHCGFDPRRLQFHTSFFSFSISGWLPTAKCVCLSVYGGQKNEKKGIVAGQKKPLGAVWCKTRLFNSDGQCDQLCNLIGGAILARSTMLAHSRAIIAYGDGRPRSKVCVCQLVRLIGISGRWA